MKLMKPDERIYQKMINKLNVASKDIYFFDDSSINVGAALECGINAFCVTGNTIKNVFENELSGIG